MDVKRYCSICGKRIVPFSTLTIESPLGTTTSFVWFSDSTEPICFGHPERQSRTPVPQAFYTALSDEEVRL